MKITKNYLKQVIKEELEKELMERQENIQEINLKGLATAGALGLASLTGGSASATPAAKAAVSSPAVSSDTVKNAAIGYLQDYINNNRSSLQIDEKTSFLYAQAILRGSSVKDKFANELANRALTKASNLMQSDRELFDYYQEIGKKVKIS